MHYPIDGSLVARPATRQGETHLAWTTTSRSRRSGPSLRYDLRRRLSDSRLSSMQMKSAPEVCRRRCVSRKIKKGEVVDEF